MMKLNRQQYAKSSIFLGAFLLFFVQPFITKILLPFFGGGQMVWITSLVFFQVFLLLGYAYAHLLTTRPLKQQKLIHLSLFTLSFASLYLLQDINASPSQETLTRELLFMLTTTIGLPFMLLASNSPIVQYWIEPDKKEETFTLYALSNAASLGALFLYPLLIEPLLGITIQLIGFTLLYGFFFAVMIRLLKDIHLPKPVKLSLSVKEKASTIFIWILFPALASSLLVSLTNKLSLDISPTPFIWIAPLFLYLLSFVYIFLAGDKYPRKFFFIVYAALLIKYVLTQGAYTPLFDAIYTYGGLVFITAIVCHGELYRAKPHSSKLTLFYLCLSVGGAIGGIFSGLIAPQLFTTQLEIPISLMLLSLVLLIPIYREKAFRTELWQMKIKATLTGLLLLALPLTLFQLHHNDYKNNVFMTRNFFGILSVVDTEDALQFLHGITMHGLQLKDDIQTPRPTSYYGEGTAIDQAIQTLPQTGNLSMGVIGLGTGALAGYRNEFQKITFYEIDQDVIKIAQSHFTFLNTYPGELNILHGDARIVLDQQEPQAFDLLVIDAFSSDAIPTHLLTSEALDIYLKHVHENGLIAFHVSNRYIELEPVIFSLADNANLTARALSETDDLPYYSTEGDWVIVSRSEIEIGEDIQERTRLWTDDYSSIVPIIRL